MTALRVLAVDSGAKRFGLAVSDPLEITANPLAVIERKGDLSEVLSAISRVVQEEEVDEVVVGLPVNMDGSHGPAAASAQSFADSLAACVKVPVRTHDERLTTVEAEGILIDRKMGRERRRGVVDKVAAAVLLRDYLRSRPRVRTERDAETG